MNKREKVIFENVQRVELELMVGHETTRVRAHNLLKCQNSTLLQHVISLELMKRLGY